MSTGLGFALLISLSGCTLWVEDTLESRRSLVLDTGIVDQMAADHARVDVGHSDLALDTAVPIDATIPIDVNVPIDISIDAEILADVSVDASIDTEILADVSVDAEILVDANSEVHSTYLFTSTAPVIAEPFFFFAEATVWPSSKIELTLTLLTAERLFTDGIRTAEAPLVERNQFALNFDTFVFVNSGTETTASFTLDGRIQPDGTLCGTFESTSDMGFVVNGIFGTVPVTLDTLVDSPARADCE